MASVLGASRSGYYAWFERKPGRRERADQELPDLINKIFAENLLNREFHAEGPGEKWVSDITYLRTRTGWLYLTVIIDLWDRKVIGWAFSGDLGARHICGALEMACGNRPPKAGLLFHSDRGVQHRREKFQTVPEGKHNKGAVKTAVFE